jgi:hypothetical protein
MEQITGDTKVAEVIQRCPAAVVVFPARGCPDMRRGFFNLMARTHERPQCGTYSQD